MDTETRYPHLPTATEVMEDMYTEIGTELTVQEIEKVVSTYENSLDPHTSKQFPSVAQLRAIARAEFPRKTQHDTAEEERREFERILEQAKEYISGLPDQRRSNVLAYIKARVNDALAPAPFLASLDYVRTALENAATVRWYRSVLPRLDGGL